MVQFVHCKYIYVCMYLIKLLLFSSEGSEA